MTLLVPNNGEGRILNNFLNKVAPQDWTLKLYKNNITPSETDTAATYTDSTFTGYAAKNLVAANWTVTEGAPSDGSAPQQTFASSADQAAELCYGYFFVQTVSGIIGWAERFTNGPYSIANNGDEIRVTPKITLD